MRVRGILAGVVASAVLAGCGGGNPVDAPGETVTVFAAASLTDAFTTIARDFEADRPGARVRLTFAGSSALATQINQGAPADVFASAAPAPMRTVTDAGHGDGAPVVFARNQLVIAVPKGNPAGVAGLADLTRPGTKVALCAEQVPCGAAARTALDAAGVALTPVTLEQDVRGALSKVVLGEVDAALVYRSDVRSTDDVRGVEFPESARAVNDYPIVVLADAPNRSGARAFVDHVRSARGRAALTAAGLQAP
ncbi:molybdate ABC transporter substrate-binding protein [Micromonospora sp. NBRC 101691]|uniref:molybdate ABC transporter substrate-binding protein n=1 Tax=Micromonospora sp. NBRC 101691 TaxID=3032198 RepID=UPI0024A15638|nr:molybdate ABC transporter substrate-binding protein [Micromonospora sp. NBRC 101691]GLY22900.1 molybdate-binding protein [Micromonospora sp. NBRC 101691]